MGVKMALLRSETKTARGTQGVVGISEKDAAPLPVFETAECVSRDARRYIAIDKIYLQSVD